MAGANASNTKTRTGAMQFIEGRVENIFEVFLAVGRAPFSTRRLIPLDQAVISGPVLCSFDRNQHRAAVLAGLR